jgi:hypothetical protein
VKSRERESNASQIVSQWLEKQQASGEGKIRPPRQQRLKKLL